MLISTKWTLSASTLLSFPSRTSQTIHNPTERDRHMPAWSAFVLRQFLRLERIRWRAVTRGDLLSSSGCELQLKSVMNSRQSPCHDEDLLKFFNFKTFINAEKCKFHRTRQSGEENLRCSSIAVQSACVEERKKMHAPCAGCSLARCT